MSKINVAGSSKASVNVSEAGSLQLHEVVIEAGGEIPSHCHETPSSYVIIEGSGTLVLDGKEKQVKNGDAFIIGSNAEHGWKNISKTLKFYSTFPQA